MSSGNSLRRSPEFNLTKVRYPSVGYLRSSIELSISNTTLHMRSGLAKFPLRGSELALEKLFIPLIPGGI